MTEKTLPQETAMPEEEGVNFLDLLIVLAKRKKMILGTTFIVAAIAAGIAWVMPNMYIATVKFLPPQSSQSTGSAMLSQLSSLGGLGGLAAGASGMRNPAFVYISMLKARTITDHVIQHFDLMRRFQAETMTDTRKKLEKLTNFTIGKDGVLVIEVGLTNPKLAAAVANYYLEELRSLIRTVAVTEASQRRQYFEQELRPARDKLTDAEQVFDKTPVTSLKYMDAIRNLKYQEALFEILIKQYEAAKLDETKDAAYIQVLETAIEPEKKAAPNRVQIVAIATLVALILAMIWAFIREAGERAKADPAKAERRLLLSQYLRWRK